MTFEFKSVHKASFICLFFVIQWTASSAVENEAKGNIPDKTTIRSISLGNFHCGDQICSDNQICTEKSTCECREGYRSYNSLCLPCGGEGDNCTRHQDCCRYLLCVNGICTRPGPSSNLATLASICLGITVITIFIALLSSIIKCLNNYDPFRRRSSEPERINPQYECERQYTNQRHIPYQPEEDKPPSYEECIGTTPRRPSFIESPPPYVISDYVPLPKTHLQSTNWDRVTQQNSETPSNVNLNREMNSEVTPSQVQIILKPKHNSI